MKKFMIYIIALMVVYYATTVHAEHVTPKPVTPVIKDGIEYSAPLDLYLMGYVVAKDIKTNSVIWKRQIYEVKFEGEGEIPESDALERYITNLAIEGENLLIVNERWQRFKLNLKTQKLSPYGEVDNLSPAASENGQNIYAFSSDGKLYAISADGDQKWVLKLSAGSTSPPGLARDGTIYVSSSVPVRLFHPNSPPSLAKDGTIYASTSEALYAVNPDGILKWEFLLPQNSISSFSVVGNDGTIYLGTRAGIIYALNPDGKVKWKFNTRGEMWHTPEVSSEGMIYAVSIQRTGKGYGSKGQVYAINNKDGSQEWMLETMDNEGRTPVIGNDDTIYVSEHYNKLYAISPKGVVKWEMEFGGGPAIAAGPDKSVYANYIYANYSNEGTYSYEGRLSKIKSDGTIELLFKTDGYSGLGLPSVGADKMIIMVSVEKSGALYSLSPSGSLKWKYNLNSDTSYGFLGSLAFDNNGTVYIGYRGKIYGTLTAINPDGTKKWEFIKRE